MFQLTLYTLFICLYMGLTGRDHTKDPEIETWLIHASSSLSVDGKTNINTFRCVVASYRQSDTLYCDLNRGVEFYHKIKSTIGIPISDFDCHHKMMTKDLQKTLKMPQHPIMYIDIKSLNPLPEQAIKDGSIGDVHISLAGAKAKYRMLFSARHFKSLIEFTGKRSILFSDFGLIPPSKLGGTIKVKDQLEVEVKLHLKKIN